MLLASCLQTALNYSIQSLKVSKEHNNAVSLGGLPPEMSLNHWLESLHTLATQTQGAWCGAALQKPLVKPQTPLCCHVLRCSSLNSFSFVVPVSSNPFSESTAVPQDLTAINMI